MCDAGIFRSFKQNFYRHPVWEDIARTLVNKDTKLMPVSAIASKRSHDPLVLCENVQSGSRVIMGDLRSTVKI